MESGILRKLSITGGLLLTTITSGVVLTMPVAKADDDSGVDDVSITIPVSCTMAGTGMDSHSKEIVNGTYESGIGTTTLKAYCNDNNGFAIFAAGYTGEEIGGENSTKLIGTPAAVGNIVTGTATSAGNPDVSNWAMKLTTNAGATYAITLDNGFGSYSAVPSAYTKVAHRDAATDYGTGATGAELTTTYAAYISRTQGAGTYTGKVIYTLVHPANEEPLQPQNTDPGYIAYYPNASTAVGTMGRQTVSTSATSATLLASNFSRDGYGFAGWNDKYDYTGNFYGPNEDITFTAGQYTGSNKGLSLYAVWVKSAGSLQSDATSVCNSLTAAPTDGTASLSSVSALTDARDSNTYAIAKLADGKCWMIENLRLDNTATDNTSGSLAQGYNASFIGLAGPEATDFSNSTTANSLYSTDGSTSAPAITGSYTGYRFPRYNNLNTVTRADSPNSNSFSNNNTTPGMYSYGNYYTWHAAIADTTYYNTNNQTISGTSLCPTNWHLPSGGQTTVNTTADFYTLGKAIMNNAEPDQNASNGYGYYGNSVTNTAGNTATKAFRQFPNNFVYSGYFYTSSAYYRGSYGSYWSSTAYNSSNSYSLILYSSNVYPGTNISNKDYGRSVRCVAGS